MSNNLIYSQEPSKRAAFITSDGKFINLQENSLLLIGYSSRDVYHNDLLNYLKYHNIEEKDLIRINDGTYLYINEEAYVELKKEPTKEQYEALLKWLDFLSINSKKKYVYVGNRSQDCRYEMLNKVNLEGILPEDIIKDIKRKYTCEENTQ